MKHQEFIDRDQLTKLYGKRMPHQQVAQIYLEEMPPIVESLERLHRDDDLQFDEVRHRAHSMAGSFSMLCVEKISTEARKLEAAALMRDRSKVKHYCRALLEYLDGLTRELVELAGGESDRGFAYGR